MTSSSCGCSTSSSVKGTCSSSSLPGRRTKRQPYTGGSVRGGAEGSGVIRAAPNGRAGRRVARGPGARQDENAPGPRRRRAGGTSALLELQRGLDALDEVGLGLAALGDERLRLLLRAAEGVADDRLLHHRGGVALLAVLP